MKSKFLFHSSINLNTIHKYHTKSVVGHVKSHPYWFYSVLLHILYYKIFSESYSLLSVSLFHFQLEEDVNLAPQTSEGGFQFDPNTSIPSEGFKF